jgi:hypothetical protein
MEKKHRAKLKKKGKQNKKKVNDHKRTKKWKGK